ncbi:MaoC/PaaZ C-terminal domain-containing protein [Alkalihalobacillus deserti]|uniref:MaoC/PaaZ C-terminal domain-containing protein n=1 Tax=Alkalihalobacillus deserti TaxID=2879466 RepID=UPI001D15C105|nr:MaoC/PaaZ C-terminal domain-containing protein [Alkalihalobacillus deserti]
MKNIAELTVGESLDEIQVGPVTRLSLIKYAGVSGDFNPIHTIEEEAEKAGLPAIIAHGMWTMGNLARVFTPFLGNGFIKEYSIRFRGMVFLNDVVTLKATVEKIHENTVTFTVSAINQEKKDVLKGQVVFCPSL